MKNIIHRVERYFSDSIRIVKGKNLNIYKKVILFYYYTKVSIVNFLNGRIINLKSIKFLSFQIYFDSISELDMLVGEVFVHEPYHFESTKDNPVIYDCGGNIGISVLYFKYLYPKAEIKVFEPSPEVFSTLQKNITNNNLEKVEAYSVALSDSDGIIDIFVRQEMSLATTTADEERHGGIRVSVEKNKLSNFIEGDVDLLKMDVQLSEVAVFNDLDVSSTMRNISQVIMEFHYSPSSEKNKLSAIIKNFEKHNFDYKIEFNAEKLDGFKTYIINAVKK